MTSRSSARKPPPVPVHTIEPHIASGLLPKLAVSAEERTGGASAELVAIVPQPGSALLPRGWCEAVFVPWLDAQGDLRPIAVCLARQVAAYKKLKADTFELLKATRYLELRWGELLGPTTTGARTDLEPSLASEGLSPDDRYRFRKMAKHAKKVREHLASATDVDELSRKAVFGAVGEPPTTPTRHRTLDEAYHAGHAEGFDLGYEEALDARPRVLTFSGTCEWYTPAEMIDAVRAVLGTIDLDPASIDEANEVVKALRYYTAADDGLLQPWAGKVYVNPPYNHIAKFCTRLVDQYEAGNVTEAVVLVGNSTETRWFQKLAGACSAICFPRGRIKFRHHGKLSSPPGGQAVHYFGPNAATFREVFAGFGFVVGLENVEITTASAVMLPETADADLGQLQTRTSDGAPALDDSDYGHWLTSGKADNFDGGEPW